MDVQYALDNYTKLELTPLCYMFDELSSDKGVGWHQYSRFYYHLFDGIKRKKINFFEMGLGTNNPDIPSNMGRGGNPGASLQIWKLFFRNAMIYGADIDKDILFQDSRIHTFYCDQLSPEDIATMWNTEELKEKQMNVILDDGLHTFEAGKVFFENSTHKLAEGGVYIIEDIHRDSVPQFHFQIDEWKEKYPEFDFWIFQVETIIHKPEDNFVLVAQKRKASS